jgi:transcriptional regulator with PAS, ATPase and Fis domain
VLQDRIIERVGDLEARPVDIRIVSATNKVLEEEIKAGRFREDLYYRLNDVTVSLPPLRARGDDIHQLAKYFLAKYSEQYEAKARGFTNEAVTAMLHFFWPGNVRELESRVKKAVIMGERALLNADDLQIAAGDKRSVKRLADAEEEFKIRYIKEVLELNNWNKAETARDLDVDPRTIFRYIEKFED